MPMTTPDQTPDTEQDVRELTDENLEEVSGGAAAVTPVLAQALADAALAEGGFTGHDLLR